MRGAAPWAVLLAVPLIAHAPELAGLISANPLYFVSGIGHTARAPWLDGSPGWIDPNAGFNTQALGREAARQWLHGRVPWWNHHAGIGVPLAAEMQCAALFLPFVLLLGAFDGVLYLKISLQITGGIACFALLRQLGMGKRAALLGAILFELNGTFCWIGDAPMLPVAFLPVVLLGIERAGMAAEHGLGGGWAWLTVGLAYAIYAGFPETVLIYLLLAGAWAAWRVISAAPGIRRKLAAKLLAGCLSGTLLAAPVLLPFAQYLAWGDLGTRGPALPGLTPANVVTYLLPTALGPPSYDWRWVRWGMSGGFAGLPLAAIAGLALRPGAREAGLRRLLALWCLAALALSAGLIPHPRAIWFARYAVPSWEMAAIVLAGFALDDWHRGARVAQRLLVRTGAGWTAAALCALALAWPAMRHVQADHPSFAVFPLVALGATGIIGAVCAWCLARDRTRRTADLLFGVLAGQALLLAAFPLVSGARNGGYDKAAVRFLQSHLGLSRFFTLGPFAPNYGSFFATASINHNLLPVPHAWVAYARARLDPAMDAVSFTGATPAGAVGGETRAQALWRRLPEYEKLGVAYVLTPPAAPPGSPDAALVFADASLRIYALAHPAPYFELRGGPCTLLPIDSDSARLACRAPGLLVRRELFFPGWRARLGHTDTPVHLADSVFQAVAVPAGMSEVTFAYAPPAIGWAYAAFGLGAAMLARTATAGFWKQVTGRPIRLARRTRGSSHKASFFLA